MPAIKRNQAAIYAMEARWFVPVVKCSNVESMMQPVIHYSTEAPQNSGFFEIHQLTGFCLVGVEHHGHEPLFLRWVGSEKCMKKFADAIQLFAGDGCARKHYHLYFKYIVTATVDDFASCWACGVFFNYVKIIVLDLCHFSRRFLKYVHLQCNSKRSYYGEFFAHQREVLHGKRFYPYPSFHSLDKIEESTSPPFAFWKY